MPRQSLSTVELQPYGDLTALNTSRLILDSLGEETLAELVFVFSKLFETSVTAFEANGQYAHRAFASGWCRMMDQASRNLCNTADNKQALQSRKWLCHESCWQTSQEAMARQSPVDSPCAGGLCIHAVPVMVHGEVVGALSFGYGDPPTEAQEQRELADKYGLSFEELRDHAAARIPREPFLIEVAKSRLGVAAKMLGVLIEGRLSKDKLRATEERLTGILDTAADGIISVDENQRIILFNKAAEQIFQYRSEEILGQSLDLLIPLRFVAAHRQLVQSFARSAEMSRLMGTRSEVFGRRKDGTEFPAEVSISKSMQVGRAICSAVIRDVTKRKATEEARRQSEEQVLLLLNSTAEAIYGIDLEGNCDFCNQACAQLLGFAKPQDLLGKHMHRLFHHSHADGKPMPERDCRIYQAFRQGQGTHVDDEVFWRADGSHFPVEYWSHPIRRAGESVGAVVTFWDISERRNLEAQYRQSQKMEAFGQLAGGVAHDFNNLLTVISGYSQIVLSKLAANDPSRAFLAEVHKAGERAAALTRQLLAFSRQQVLEPQVLDLNAVVTDTEKMLRRLIGEDINLHTVLAPKLDPVKVDPGQIEQVILNLAVNARDAMPEGGRLTIETANVDVDELFAQSNKDINPGRYVMLTVSDAGCGMSDEVKARIFEPFFTTKRPGKGTGLGLATVFGIIKQSGGHINVYSELGQGTSFKIYLPIVHEKISSSRSMHGAPTIPTGSETLLLVEDEDAVRLLCRRALAGLGYNILDAGNGQEALIICQQHQGTIHLLVSDVVMPEIGGRKLAEQLTALRPDMKVLYLSGYTNDAVVYHGVLHAEVAFLQKPFTVTSLANKVREVLDQRLKLATEG